MKTEENMLILGIIVGVLALYALTTGIVLCFAKIEKEPDGTPILDANSWHFKLAYPIQRHDPYFIREISGKRISICAYFIKLFFTLWIGWPIILVVSVMNTVIASAICLPFGRVAIADWREWYGNPDLWDMFRFEKIKLPAIRDYRIFPVYLVAPAVYIWLLRLNSKLTLGWTFLILKIVLVIAVVIALCTLYSLLARTDQKKVSLAREWLRAKKNRWCPLMKVRTGKVSTGENGAGCKSGPVG